MNKTTLELMVNNGTVTTHLTRRAQPINWHRVVTVGAQPINWHRLVTVGLALAVIVLIVWR